MRDARFRFLAHIGGRLAAIPGAGWPGACGGAPAVALERDAKCEMENGVAGRRLVLAGDFRETDLDDDRFGGWSFLARALR